MVFPTFVFSPPLAHSPHLKKFTFFVLNFWGQPWLWKLIWFSLNWVWTNDTCQCHRLLFLHIFTVIHLYLLYLYFYNDSCKFHQHFQFWTFAFWWKNALLAFAVENISNMYFYAWDNKCTFVLWEVSTFAIARGTTDPEIDSVTWTKFGNNMAPLTLFTYII